MNIVDSIRDYISPTYTNKSKDIISKLPMPYLNKLLSMYTQQSDKLIKEYTIFTLSDNSVELINNYSTESDKDTYQVIYYDTADKNYIFQAFAFQELYELIIINNSRYVFVPIMFSYKDSKVGHILVYEKLIFLDNLYINLPINY